MSFALETSLLHLLHRASQAAEEAFERNDPAVTARQLIVLEAIGSMAGCSQTELVATTGIDRSTMADVIRRMQAKALLRRRRRKDDARAYIINLTERGENILKSCRHAAGSAERLLDHTSGRDDRTRLCELLADFISAHHEQRAALESREQLGARA